ncbi:MAG TPA: hypothetical protein VN716_18810 [Vicinamibacterales bacterium]|nr:hypothetical protein [Vicinamibacterales bacterium]
MREATAMTIASPCAERGCAKLRRLVVRLLDSSVRSREHFELRAALAALADQQGWYDVHGLPPDQLEDVAADAVAAPEWPIELPKIDDFRDEATKAADAQLDGDWWRCPEHGLTPVPIYLCGAAYCPDEKCSRNLLHVRGGA